MNIAVIYLLAVFTILTSSVYIGMVVKTNSYRKKWSNYKTASWITAIVLAALAVLISHKYHMSFVSHMLVHLLLGMLIPLLMVLASPITLVLRTLNTTHARRLTRLLNTEILRLLLNPVFTAILNVGGLWLLYTTNLFNVINEHSFWNAAMHFHLLTSGFLFTASIIYRDPVRHQHSFLLRAAALVAALAGHDILSKYIYAYPPAGIPSTEAEFGGMMMYYGGGLIDIILIYLLCAQSYRVQFNSKRRKYV